VTNNIDDAALRLLRADLDQLAHHLSRLDRGSRHQLARVVAEMLERVTAAPQNTRR
jgi:hypothetical protein